MSRLRVNCFSVSLDGYGAGPDQSLENPLGRRRRGPARVDLPTRTFQKMYGKDEGTTGVDDDFAARGFDNVGAWILGRNMFGPVRGAWPDESWKGWWGDNPPYHVPVFVLTHHAAQADRDGGRHDLPFRHGRNSRGARAGPRRGQGQGRQARRRRQHHPAISRGPA